MSRIVALVVCRPCASGQLITVASGLVDIDEGCSSSEISPHIHTDKEICSILQNRVRLHFTNHGRIELENHILHYSVVCAEPCTLVYALITQPEKPSDRSQYFLTEVQGVILSEAQLLMLIPQCGEHELQPHIQPMLVQLMMTENSAQNSQSQKVDELRQQVDTVKSIMTTNVERIMERGDRLESIQQRTDDLAASSANFKLSARRVQRKFCMMNAKWTIITILATLILLAIIVIIILSAAGVFKSN